MSAASKLIRNLARSQLQKQLSSRGVQSRWLNLQEFQSKKLMLEHGIHVQKFQVVSDAKIAADAARELNVEELVVKAQIMAGGRGKGVFDNGFRGGVHLTKDPEKVAELVEKMIGKKLYTKQTPEDGVMVKQVMVAHALDIARETYFAILMDREHDGPVMVGSPMGGVDIEEVAEKHPQAIFKETIDITTGITDEQVVTMARNLGFQGEKEQMAASQIKRLYELFLKVDATQVEINPFGETTDGEVVCFDAKINFDDNAAFRQREIFALNDKSESDWREIEADLHNLNYIGMDGNIGCLVNGAGLAMATMDIIKYHGGEPANFLDVGGNVNETQVYNAFRLLSADTQVKSILVNVFAGIVNCVTIANGIKNACQNINMSIPIIVRLEGNNVEKAKSILEASKLSITTACSLQDAAQKAVDSLERDHTKQNTML